MFDFVIGLFHFVLFYVLAATIDFERTPGWIFPATLALILLYDLGWLGLTRKFKSTNRRVKYWAFLNIVTVLFTIGAYKLAWWLKPNSHALSREAVSYSVIVAISLVDIAELVKGKGLISEWFDKKLKRFQAWIAKNNPYRRDGDA